MTKRRKRVVTKRPNGFVIIRSKVHQLGIFFQMLGRGIKWLGEGDDVDANSQTKQRPRPKWLVDVDGGGADEVPHTGAGEVRFQLLQLSCDVIS